MVNRSEVMKAAWSLYRSTYHMAGKRPFYRDGFVWALTEAWRRAKIAARTAALSAAAKAERVASIEYEIAMLSYRDAQQDVEPMRRALVSERLALAA